VFDVGEDEGRPFMAMEYISGETLTRVLRRDPALLLVRRLGLMEELCAGLAHAHAAGIVHRDVKPANLMLDGEGVLKILDFGIARLANSGMTQDGMMMGSVNYMSPEQLIGRGVDHHTDIFASGAVLYEAIALEQAFPGAIDSGVLHSIREKGSVPLDQRVPSVDPELVRIVHQALEREPERRYDDINVMRRDIARVRRRLLEDGHESGVDSPHDRTIVTRPKTATSGTGRPVDSDRRRKMDPERFAEYDASRSKSISASAVRRWRKETTTLRSSTPNVPPRRSDNRLAFELLDKARFAIEAKAYASSFQKHSDCSPMDTRRRGGVGR
jgi:serine/threonine-protein kinase